MQLSRRRRRFPQSISARIPRLLLRLRMSPHRRRAKKKYRRRSVRPRRLPQRRRPRQLVKTPLRVCFSVSSWRTIVAARFSCPLAPSSLPRRCGGAVSAAFAGSSLSPTSKGSARLPRSIALRLRVQRLRTQRRWRKRPRLAKSHLRRPRRLRRRRRPLSPGSRPSRRWHAPLSSRRALPTVGSRFGARATISGTSLARCSSKLPRRMLKPSKQLRRRRSTPPPSVCSSSSRSNALERFTWRWYGLRRTARSLLKRRIRSRSEPRHRGASRVQDPTSCLSRGTKRKGST
mmetsp:Transcript_17504/g.57267  ORF Transcript_17504/g.57267 Transcript_17504/m.57267 type:complete len:289 (+) Transcript_17504:108-974(+)